jgi:hypothetical protein
MMLYSRLTTALLCGAVLLSLAACSDPGGVGTDVGREPLSGGTPSEKSVFASPTSDTTEISTTGLDGSDQSWRFLTGRVADDWAGTLQTNGYVDLGGTEGSNPFDADTPASSLNATLRLVPTYRHGDTTATLNVELYDLQSSVDMDGASANESFATTGGIIQSYSIDPADFSAPLDQNTVVLDLPQSWIDANKNTLTSDGDINGFKLTPTGGNSIIVGFEHGSATLRVTTDSDTVDFGVQQSFTHIEQVADPTTTPAANQQLLLDGVGRGLAFNWTDSDEFAALTESVAINRAQIQASFDTDLYNNTPTDFVRPAPSDYRILAARRSGGPGCGALNLFTENDQTCVFPMATGLGAETARSDRGFTFDTFDRWFSDSRPLDAFRIEIADREQVPSSPEGTTRRGLPSTIPAIINLDKSDGVRLTLTVTQL